MIHAILALHALDPLHDMLVGWAVGVPVLAGLAWWQAWYRWSWIRPVMDVLDEGSGRKRGVLLRLGFDGRFRGRAITLRETPGGRYGSTCLDVTVECRAPFPFRFGREGRGAGIAKRLRLLQDVEIGDPRFDRLFTFRASEPERLVAWLRSSREARHAIWVLLAGDTEPDDDSGLPPDPVDGAVFVRGSRLCFVRRNWGTWLVPDETRRMLKALRALAESAERA
jgi:hypothetical protein